MGRTTGIARLHLLAAIVLTCLAAGCGKDEGGTPEPPDPPKPVETVMEAFKKTTVPGAYDLSGDVLTAIVSYAEEDNQYSYFEDAEDFRAGVTDLNKGVAFRAESPANMIAGNSYAVSVTSAGSDALSSVKGKDRKLSCVKAAAALYWLVDSENGIGFILARKEL